MKKRNSFFWHDADTRNHPKMLKLRSIFGQEGYGVYFMLVEILHKHNNSYPLNKVKNLAIECEVSEETIIRIIYDFDLFIIENNMFCL